MLDQAERRFGPAELQALSSLAITMAVMAVLLFWPAGTLAWSLGWWFIGVFTALTLVAIFWLWRVNPEIFAARRRFRQEGSKGWDVDCRLADDDRDRRHIARRGPRRRALSAGLAAARLGHRMVGYVLLVGCLCLGRLGASGQPSFRADRAHPEGPRAQG